MNDNIYNLIEFYSSCGLKILDNKTILNNQPILNKKEKVLTSNEIIANKIALKFVMFYKENFGIIDKSSDFKEALELYDMYCDEFNRISKKNM